MKTWIENSTRGCIILVLIFGSRVIDSVYCLDAALDEAWFADRIDSVITGEAEGADTLGKQWALMKNLPYEGFAADWSLGRRAGPIRNAKMLDVLLTAQRMGMEVGAIGLLMKGGSRGSMNMLGLLRNSTIPERNIYCKEFQVDPDVHNKYWIPEFKGDKGERQPN